MKNCTLSPDEHEAIQKIITDSQNLMRKTMTDARLEIREQLTPAQRNQFDELVKRPPPRRHPVTRAGGIEIPRDASTPRAITNAPPSQPLKGACRPVTNAPGV